MATVLSGSVMVRVRRGWVSLKRGTSVTVARGPDMAKGISTMILCRIWKAETGSCLFLGVSRLQRDHMDQLRQPGDSRCIIEKVVCKQSNSEQKIREVVQSTEGVEGKGKEEG